MKQTFAAIAILSFIACSTQPTIPDAPALIENGKTRFVNYKIIDASSIIDGPPAENTTEYEADYSTIREWQRNRTKEQCGLAKSEVSYKNILDFFEKPRGPLSPTETAPFKPLFDQLDDDSKPVWTLAKNQWRRPRPYFVVSGIRPCIKRESSTSYPSGTAALAHLTARVLSDLFPNREDEIMKRAFDIGENRVIGGVHHPSDVKDARKLADAVYHHVMKNKAFQQALQTAQSKQLK